MAVRRKIWETVWGEFVSPKVSGAELERCFRQVHDRLPVPVFWLLGKTQSGKTSLIRALTDNSRAEIGNGFRPCTRTAQEYPFPAEDDCILRFLDTRGLGEVSYDPTDDLRLFQNQAHLLIVVMKALDHAQQSVVEAVREIHAARSHWPILVVQTTLHEGYAYPEQQHLQPYPYGTVPFPPQVPADLARSLLMQREMLTQHGIAARFVPVDFTLPEDGYIPVNYGLELLWEAIEEMLPLGLRGMLARAEQVRGELRDAYFRRAHPHVISYALAAGAAASFPLPMVDTPVLLGIQAKMFHTIASIYGQQVSQQRMGDILSALGIGFLGRLGGRELLKVIPGYGSAVSALYAAACTYGLGLTLCIYFSRVRDGDVPTAEEFQKIYQVQFEAGRQKLRSYLDSIRSKSQNPVA